jgi:Domain of unknown function (DUF1816)
MLKQLASDVTDIWTDFLNLVGCAWWIEIFTAQPKCIYYFGPFAKIEEAQTAIAGYISDLESESAQGIRTQLKRCKPNLLTIEYTPAREAQIATKLGLSD